MNNCSNFIGEKYLMLKRKLVERLLLRMLVIVKPKQKNVPLDAAFTIFIEICLKHYFVAGTILPQYSTGGKSNY